jgi:mRNA interferase MazF
LPQPAGHRPVLLLSRPDAYAYLNKVTVVEITTTIRQIPVELPLGRADGLSKRSVANCDNIRTIARAALKRRIGKLTESRIPELKRAFGLALGWHELVNLAPAVPPVSR